MTLCLHRISKRYFFPFCLFLFFLALANCGKSGLPVPKKTQETFTIPVATLSSMGDCLVARGEVSGAIQSVDTMILEVAPIDFYDNCPGCPFVAREYGEFSTSGMQLDKETGQFIFSFCPALDAPMYRWRLVGKNIFPGLPHVTTSPQVMVMP